METYISSEPTSGPSDIEVLEGLVAVGARAKIIRNRTDSEGTVHTMTSFVPTVSLRERAEAERLVQGLPSDEE